MPEVFGHWLGIGRGGRVRDNEARVGLEGHDHMRAKMRLGEPMGKGLAQQKRVSLALRGRLMGEPRRGLQVRRQKAIDGRDPTQRPPEWPAQMVRMVAGAECDQ